MADKLMRAQVSIPRVGGMPEDTVTNTWYFDGDDGNTDGDYHTGVMSLLTAFYQAIDTPLYADVNSTTATVKIYDMRDPEPRTPEHTNTITLTYGTDTALPSEVALVMSFAAATGSGLDPRRRRGRVYLGPVRSTAGAESAGDNRPTSAVLTAVAGAGDTMLNGASMTIGTCRWAVFSPTTFSQTSDLDASFHDVVSGYVDNAWDTQRRRGADATTRTLFS